MPFHLLTLVRILASFFFILLSEVVEEISRQKLSGPNEYVVEILPNNGFLPESGKSDVAILDALIATFPNSEGGIEEINRRIDEKLPADAFRPAVMAKIEKPSCFFDDNLKNIIALSDGIMVARGDFGVECAKDYH